MAPGGEDRHRHTWPCSYSPTPCGRGHGDVESLSVRQVSAGSRDMTPACLDQIRRGQHVLLLGGISPSFLLFPLWLSLFFLLCLHLKRKRNWSKVHSRAGPTPFQGIIFHSGPDQRPRESQSHSHGPPSSTRQPPVAATAASSANHCFKSGHICLPPKTVKEGSPLNKREIPGRW